MLRKHTSCTLYDKKSGKRAWRMRVQPATMRCRGRDRFFFSANSTHSGARLFNRWKYQSAREFSVLQSCVRPHPGEQSHVYVENVPEHDSLVRTVPPFRNPLQPRFPLKWAVIAFDDQHVGLGFPVLNTESSLRPADFLGLKTVITPPCPARNDPPRVSASAPDEGRRSHMRSSALCHEDGSR